MQEVFLSFYDGFLTDSLLEDCYNGDGSGNMKKFKFNIVSLIGTLSTLFMFFVLSLVIKDFLNVETMIPPIFILAVFLVSLNTEGYFYGVIASLVSTLAINFAFTFPYFQFNFLIPENMISAVILLFITIVTCTLTTKIREQERIKAEIDKEKMKANLLRAVSHDLRTPLTTISGSSSMICDQFNSLDDNQIQELAKGIKEDSNWLISMVENLLTVTRIDNDLVKIVKNPTVLEELIDSVLLKMEKRFPEQKIIVEIPDDFIVIAMDAVLIQQVLLNLFENAIYHAKGMDELKLHVFTQENKAVFEVINNGEGIDKDKLKTLFSGTLDKRHHIDSKKKSMGIGLSVCAAIVKAHNGEISARNLDKGCCFQFILDMEDNYDL